MKQKILLSKRLEIAWHEWNDALGGLDAADFDLLVYRQWNLKDILGHVYSYLHLALRHVESYQKRKRLASPRAPSYSYFNRREAERLRRVPLAQLCANLDATYRDLMAVLPALSDEDLQKVFPAQWWNSKYHTTLRAILREEAEHLGIHAGDVKKWREGERANKSIKPVESRAPRSKTIRKISKKSESRILRYDPFARMTFSYDRCFLCGQHLKSGKSVEHVFPKWLQNKYNLWDEKIILLNKSSISYRQLTIPCCIKCNNEYLSSLESTIQRALEMGYSEFANLDELKIFQWISKMFYGILFKELSLPIDRKDPSLGFIASPELLKRFRELHAFLQSVRTPFRFDNFTPWSIFILETHKYNDRLDFDYHDGIESLTFAIRMSGIGIIACLQDNGAQKEIFSDYFRRFNGIKLHPIQFNELFANLTYKSTLMNRTPTYVISIPRRATEETQVIALPLQGVSLKPIYDDWDPETYSHYLANYCSKWGIRFEDIYRDGKILTFLQNEDDSVRILDAEGNFTK